MSIGRNTILGFGADITIVLLGIIVSIVLTRSLGPDGRGIYALLITTNILAANLFHLSVASASSTYLGRGRFRLGEVNSVCIVLAAVLGLLALLIVSVLYPLLSNNVLENVPYQYLFVALLLVPATIYQIYWSYMLMGLSRVGLMNKLNLAANLVNAVLMILVVGVLGLGIPGFLAVWVLNSLITLTASIILSARIEPPQWPPSLAVARQLLGFGLRSHGANIAHHVFLRFDTYAINALIGAVGVGFYSLSTSLAERVWLPLNAVHAASLGKITQLPRDEAAILTAKVARAALLITLSVALPLAAVSPWLVPFLYGDEFFPSVLPLVILLAGTVAFAIMFVLNSYILGQMERPGLLSIISWLQLGISVPLYLALISWQGIVGAALASTFTYMVAMVASLVIFARDSRLSPLQVLIPRPSDFGDYFRVLQRAWRRLPLVNRQART
jgi:O-antigen/teichoic acid export membrane protein